MVTKNNSKIEIDLGMELMEKLETVTKRKGITPEELIRNFVLDYIVSGGNPGKVSNSQRKNELSLLKLFAGNC